MRRKPNSGPGYSIPITLRSRREPAHETTETRAMRDRLLLLLLLVAAATTATRHGECGVH